MTRTRVLALLAALLAVALLAAGCGGLSKEEYEEKVQKIGAKVQRDMESFQTSGQPSADDIEKAEEALDEAADDIEDIDPPSDVEKLHEQLVDVLHDTADLFGDMAPLLEKASKDPSSLDKDDLSELNEVTSRFDAITKRMEKVEKGFADKKYDVGLDDDSSSDSGE